LAASPRYIIGTISLGALVQSAQAFQQVAAALSFPVDNLAKMAEWRASVERVLGLAHALGDLEEDITHPDPNTIVVEETQQPALVFHVLSIADPDGTVVLDGFEEQIQPGERVFLSGDHSVGVKLFKVIARLWPWGRGRVELPEGNRMFFMPPRPYLPIETLQRAVTYPALPDAFDISTVEHALRVSGLEELIDNLQDSKSWENVLSREQQQRLGVARLLLHRPRWILFQEALDSLAAEEAKTLLQMIFNELPDSAMLTLTNRSGIETLHHRQIQIHCPSCASPLKKATRQRREQNRRNQGEVSPVDQLIGSLRKDRRKS
jgi:putative ATP-binding cassette transporter